MTRIEAISSYIDSNDNVLDVGCDQVELGINLAKRNIKSSASDISIEVIKSAKEKINKLKLNDYINIYVCDGINNVSDNIDTLVLAGMGYYTIKNILEGKRMFKKIITISNNNNDKLRIFMNSNNYKIKNELIIKEKNKYYNLIVFIPGNEVLTPEEILLGRNHSDIRLLGEYIKYLYNKIDTIKVKSNNKNTNINELYTILKNRIR